MAHDVINCPNCGKPVVLPEVAVPSGLGDVCARFPELCRSVKRLEAKMTEVEAHPKPSVELFKEWRECKDCSPALERLLKDRTELFVPKEEAEESRLVDSKGRMPWQ